MCRCTRYKSVPHLYSALCADANHGHAHLDESGNPHDSWADKNLYPHDGRADKDSYLHDSNNQCIILWLHLSLVMINVQLMLF